MTETEIRRELILRRVQQQLRDWDGVSGGLFCLSFVQEEKPEGERFAGACIVQSPTREAAMAVAALHGCNPCGEVLIVELPELLAKRVADKWRNRLLTREDCAAFDSDYGGTIQ